MGQKERRRGIRRPEKGEQLARIAEIVEQKRSPHEGWDEKFRREHGFSGGLVHAVMLEAKKEGLSTALVFGYFLKKDREKAGLKQGELGMKVEELGLGKRISKSLISRFESGERLGEEFPSKTLLSVIAVLGAPDNAFWALMEHYEHTWPESTATYLKVYGQLALLGALRDRIIPFDASKYSHTLKGD